MEVKYSFGIIYGGVTNTYMVVGWCNGMVIYTKEFEDSISAQADFERLIRSNTQQ